MRVLVLAILGVSSGARADAVPAADAITSGAPDVADAPDVPDAAGAAPGIADEPTAPTPDQAPPDTTRVAAAEPPGLTAPAPEASLRHVVDVPAPPPVLDQVAGYDAAYDRAFLTSSAMTLAPGHVDVSARSALDHGGIAGIAVGLARDFELSINGAKVGGVGKGLGVDLKVAVLRHDTWAAAITGGVFGEWSSSGGTTSKLFTTAIRITTCTGATCNGLFTFGGGFAVSSNDVTPMLDSSFVIGKGFVRPLLELQILTGEIGFFGARFGGRHVGVDVGIGKIWGDLSYAISSDPMAMLGVSIRP